MTLHLAEAHPARTCQAPARSHDGTCKQLAIPGGTVCAIHGGATPSVRQAALRRLSDLRDVALARLIEDLSPGSLVDPKVKLDVVEKVTKLIELMEGRATDRTLYREESEAVRTLNFRLDRVATRLMTAIDLPDLPLFD